MAEGTSLSAERELSIFRYSIFTLQNSEYYGDRGKNNKEEAVS